MRQRPMHNHIAFHRRPAVKKKRAPTIVVLRIPVPDTRQRGTVQPKVPQGAVIWLERAAKEGDRRSFLSVAFTKQGGPLAFGVFRKTHQQNHRILFQGAAHAAGDREGMARDTGACWRWTRRESLFFDNRLERSQTTANPPNTFGGY